MATIRQRSLKWSECAQAFAAGRLAANRKAQGIDLYKARKWGQVEMLPIPPTHCLIIWVTADVVAISTF